ncbi:hypothetical protein B5807_09671 [Epicoccum nigrum]|uniref:Uncharacterized protein n=1 Tax=Epicoccum nigrum TaxID=105696 RepID=A0A1Y2LPY5_EPING|nr:hypothetical protein B5807_09671 [Epicoccum nigrum]
MHTSRPETNSCACWYQPGRKRFTGVRASQEMHSVDLEGHGSARLRPARVVISISLGGGILRHSSWNMIMRPGCPSFHDPSSVRLTNLWEILTKQSGKPRHCCRPVAWVEDVIDGDCAGRAGSHMELQLSCCTWLRSTTVSCNVQLQRRCSRYWQLLRIQYVPSAGGSTPTAFNFKPAIFLCLRNNTTPFVPTITNFQPLHNSSLQAMPRLSEHAKLERLASAPTNRMWSSPPRR